MSHGINRSYMSNLNRISFIIAMVLLVMAMVTRRDNILWQLLSVHIPTTLLILMPSSSPYCSSSNKSMNQILNPMHITLSPVLCLKIYLVILLVMKFCHFVKKKIKKILSQIPCFKRKFNKFPQLKKDSPKIVTIACNMKGCLRFSTLIL
jgi:anaerobic C4-dicarboxylate transporter